MSGPVPGKAGSGGVGRAAQAGGGAEVDGTLGFQGREGTEGMEGQGGLGWAAHGAHNQGPGGSQVHNKVQASEGHFLAAAALPSSSSHPPATSTAAAVAPRDAPIAPRDGEPTHNGRSSRHLVPIDAASHRASYETRTLSTNGLTSGPSPGLRPATAHSGNAGAGIGVGIGVGVGAGLGAPKPTTPHGGGGANISVGQSGPEAQAGLVASAAIAGDTSADSEHHAYGHGDILDPAAFDTIQQWLYATNDRH